MWSSCRGTDGVSKVVNGNENTTPVYKYIMTTSFLLDRHNHRPIPYLHGSDTYIALPNQNIHHNECLYQSTR